MQNKRAYLADSLLAGCDLIKDGEGKNVIPQPKKKPLLLRYLEKFSDPIIIVLIVVFVFSVIVNLYEIISMGRSWVSMLDSLGVLVALLLATGIGFIFEVRAEKEFEILNRVKNDRPVLVYRRKREGARPQLHKIKKCDVVVGDIVKIEGGDEIPADGMLLDAVSLRMDESIFTGELYARKTVDVADFDADATYPSNVVLRGTTMIEGQGIYKVTAVGLDTEEGKGALKVQEGSNVRTPLNDQLDRLGHIISIASFIIAGLIIVGRLIYYFAILRPEAFVAIDFAEFMLGSIMLAVTLIVVAVPEGLPMSITVSLALSMKKMLKEKNLVRKLHACETMGAATVICTDKTGTLTKNQMTVVEHQFYSDADLIYQNISINSTAELSQDDGRLIGIGNPTESAMLKWLVGQGVEYLVYRDMAKIVHQTPFSSESKIMTTTVQVEDGGYLAYLKGAPEIVLGMCSAVEGGADQKKVKDVLMGYQGRAMRTLAFAYQRKQALEEPDNFVFAGIVGIADPLRDDVVEAIHTCKDDAGVRVIVVTGDTPATAEKIGRDIGLVEDGGNDIVMTAAQFNQLSDEDAMRTVSDVRFKILSRARPEDKVRLVELLQRAGEVVAVTGDGTNDAPALSKAQVGLSMGDGTSRAKEASDITIIDNSFASINKAIMWGRSIYQNIRRFIVFQMTINVCACFIVLLGAFIGLDSPLTVTQMLWVNLIMDTFAALALSSLPADKHVLEEKPRNPKSNIIDRKMTKWIFGAGLIFFVLLTGLWQLLWHLDVSPSLGVAELLNWDTVREAWASYFSPHAKTHLSGYESALFFTTFVFLQFWNLFNARYYHTGRSLLQDMAAMISGKRRFTEVFGWGFVGIVLAILFGQVLIVTFAGPMFGVSPLSWTDWLLLLAITSPVLIFVDGVRCVKNVVRFGGARVRWGLLAFGMVVLCACGGCEPTCNETVRIDEQHGLTIFTPLYDDIELYCGEEGPDTNDKSIIFACSAAFTKDYAPYSHENIRGSHMSEGIYYPDSVAEKRGEWGAFLYYGGQYQFTVKNIQQTFDSAQGGMGFMQYMVVADGASCKQWRTNECKYRVLCEKDGVICIVESTNSMPYADFVDSLMAYGPANALYMDMGGWDYCVYRDCYGNIVNHGGYWHSFSTNCIVFRKRNIQ